MKKYLPIALLVVGVLVLVGAFFVVKGRRVEKENPESESQLLDVPLNERPFVSLTPKADGHYLTLGIERISIPADMLDYELLYESGDVMQGVPGTVNLEGKDSFEVELLLGTESSGKFRYDEGVEKGTLNLRFRDKKGKLVARFESDFRLLTNEKTLTSFDNKFKFTLDSSNRGSYFVVMHTVGLPDKFNRDVVSGPYGVLTHLSESVSGTVEVDTGTPYMFDTKNWEKLEDGEAKNVGVFVIASD